MGVGVDPALPLEPRSLNCPCPLDPAANDGASLVLVLADQVAIRDRRNFQMDVDPVEQRARDPRAIPLYGKRTAAAGMDRIAEVAAGTSPRCLSAILP